MIYSMKSIYLVIFCWLKKTYLYWRQNWVVVRKVKTVLGKLLLLTLCISKIFHIIINNFRLRHFFPTQADILFIKYCYYFDAVDYATGANLYFQNGGAKMEDTFNHVLSNSGNI